VRASQPALLAAGRVITELRDQMVEALRVWIAAGKPKAADKLPRSSKGDIIRKVRVASKDKVAIELHGGTVDRLARTRQPSSALPRHR
jgi:CRISPR-associated endonuclease Csn1